MGHVYATLEELKAYLTGGDYGTGRDASLLTLLESSSRRVDGYCKRGSGFGPVVATHTYQSAAGPDPGRPPWILQRGRLLLQDDLVDLTDVTIDGTVQDIAGFTAEPRALSGTFGRGTTIVVGGTWGYGYELVSTAAKLDAALNDSDTSATIDDSSPLVAGQMLVIDDEQLLVEANDLDMNVLTVLRAQNGTTAAAHNDEAAISRVRYAAEVVDATMRVAQRRWKMRDAGLTMDFGGGPVVPMSSNQDSEVSILRATVGHLAIAVIA